jgi:triacylglycerol esterase/lipase EstA (alpha/beta hydrolase family)
MKKILLSLAIASSFTLFAQPKDEYLICLHGIMGTKFQMYFMAKNLRKEGFNVINWGYPSRSYSIEKHAVSLIEELKILSKKKPGQPINFVAHSMGGLVLRAAINHPGCPEEAKMGKVVLIATPNQGSSLARYLSRFSFVRKVLQNKSGRQLMTKKDFEYLGQFPHAKEDILVLAGRKNFNPIMKEKSDGTVTIEETYLSTPHNHKIVNKGHNSILYSKTAYRMTKNFLNP